MDIDPLDVGDLTGIAALVVAVIAAFISGLAKREARRSATAAEDSAESSKRSAAAAEASAQADATMARLAEEEAAKYTVPWRLQVKKKGQYLLMNEGDEDAVDVTIGGDVVAANFENGGTIRAHSAITIIDVRSMGSAEDLSVEWSRPELAGGGRQPRWTHAL